MKICSRCKKTRSKDMFCNKKSSPDGLNWWCKICEKEYKKEFKKNNKEKVNGWKRNWEKNNSARTKELRRKSSRKNHEKNLLKYKNRTQEEKNKKAKQHKEWVLKNKEKNNATYNKWQKERYHRDYKFKIVCNLRSGLQQAFKSFSKNGKAKQSAKYGIDFNAIVKKLGVPPNINSSIDHIFPCSAFNHSNNVLVWACWHPDNFQWLDLKCNISKNNSFDENKLKIYVREKEREYKLKTWRIE